MVMQLVAEFWGLSPLGRSSHAACAEGFHRRGSVAKNISPQDWPHARGGRRQEYKADAGAGASRARRIGEQVVQQKQQPSAAEGRDSRQRGRQCRVWATSAAAPGPVVAELGAEVAPAEAGLPAVAPAHAGSSAAAPTSVTPQQKPDHRIRPPAPTGFVTP